MKIRYQADNDLDQRIIDAVARLVPESDFKTAPEAGFHTGTSDPEILRIAAADNRILVSHDLRTLPQHFGEFIGQSISPGVIIIRQEVTIRDAALWLQFFWEVGVLEDFKNTIRIVSQPF
jgi:predicted nuclease of predicted toxin-antitoxin system